MPVYSRGGSRAATRRKLRPKKENRMVPYLNPFEDRDSKAVTHRVLAQQTVETLRNATPADLIGMGVRAGMQNARAIELLEKYPNGEVPEGEQWGCD